MMAFRPPDTQNRELDLDLGLGLDPRRLPMLWSQLLADEEFQSQMQREFQTAVAASMQSFVDEQYRPPDRHKRRRCAEMDQCYTTYRFPKHRR